MNFKEFVILDQMINTRLTDCITALDAIGMLIHIYFKLPPILVQWEEFTMKDLYLNFFETLNYKQNFVLDSEGFVGGRNCTGW